MTDSKEEARNIHAGMDVNNFTDHVYGIGIGIVLKSLRPIPMFIVLKRNAKFLQRRVKFDKPGH